MESASPTSSAAGSRARTSVSPVRVPVWTVSDPACGENMRASLATFDPASRSWRTSGLFAVEDSPLFSETLPRSGMTQSGTLFLLPPLVHLTSAIASGLSPALATPTATMGDRGGRGDLIQQLRGNASPSGHYKALLPTPTASLGDSSGRTVPSPSTAQMRYAQGKRNLDDWVALNGAGLLPSPGANDDRDCADYSDRSRGHSPQLRHLGKGRLNPRFVEWMMGFPLDWTALECAPSETPSSPRSRK